MKVSVISQKYPTYRDEKIRSCKRWLDGRRLDDNAEGLWRVHNKLYDLTDFVQRHPGGAEWLDLTKGIDITEQFEIHHITGKAEQVLTKFYVREASLPRNYKITFDENGFYKTLKRKVAYKYNSINQNVRSKSQLYFDLTLLTTLALSVLTTYINSRFVIVFASASLTTLMNVTHNFIHQRDNWRMYAMNLTFFSFRDWRGLLLASFKWQEYQICV